MADRKKGVILGIGLLAVTIGGAAVLLGRKRPPAMAPTTRIPPAAAHLSTFRLSLLSSVGNHFEFSVKSVDMNGTPVPNVPYEVQVDGTSEFSSRTSGAGDGSFYLDLPSLSGFTIEVVAGPILSNPISLFVP